MDHEIKVGIKTLGKPEITEKGDVHILHNMLIGDGFHWQKTVRATLQGQLEEYYGEDNVSLINTLPLETYLESVVGSEMNPSAPVEFLKAHAVISRSWALGKILDVHLRSKKDYVDSENLLTGWDDTSSHQGFHVCSDDHCQRYQGIQNIPEINLQALRQTRNEVLTTEDGRILDARFSKCCGGRTELFSTCWQNESVPGLQSFVDPWCDLSELSPISRRGLLKSILKDYDQTTKGYGYNWTHEITKKDVERNLMERFDRNIGKVESIEVFHRGPSGRIDLLRIKGTTGHLDLGKELWIRRLLSDSHLYSSAFEIKDTGDSFILTGKGWGHGVGLCQIGAAHMASQGHSYREILQFYYPGSTVSIR